MSRYVCLSLCEYHYVTDGEIFEVMEHEKSILDTKHKKRVLLMIKMATSCDEMDNLIRLEVYWEGDRFSVMLEIAMNQRGASNDFFISI